MVFEKIKGKPRKLTENAHLNAWLTHLGYTKKSLAALDQEEHSPALLNGIDSAADLILRSIADKELIMVSGDYDADGICGTTILVQGFLDLGGRVSYMIPDRIKDGYGLNIRLVDRAIEEGASLIVTIDNGVACHEAIQYAKDKGVKVVMTDHHTLQETLPLADAIVHPQLSTILPGYPFPDISGATVAYKLIRYLFEKTDPDSADLQERLDYLRCLAGITVISDVMPLVDENRQIFKASVAYLKEKRNRNLEYLLDVLGVSLETLNEIDYGFSICPLINAVGRIANAETGVQYFFSQTEKERTSRAAALTIINDKRKELNKVQLESVSKQVDDSHPGIVIFNETESLHEGLIGILAGRLCNEYSKPVVLFTKAIVNGQDAWKASARSVDDVNLFEVLQSIAADDPDMFINYGGHAGAAGLSIPYNKKSDFERLYYDEVSKHFQEAVVQYVDVNAEEVADLLKAMKEYAPWGQGFPKPVIHITFSLRCAKCYFASGRAVWTDDFFSIWKELDETLDLVKDNQYILAWSNYDKLLLNGDIDPSSNKTEYYRPGNGAVEYDLYATVTNSWFGGKSQPQLDILKMEKL